MLLKCTTKHHFAMACMPSLRHNLFLEVIMNFKDILCVGRDISRPDYNL